MREFINIVEGFLVEGGNVFKSPEGKPLTQNIQKQDVPETVTFLEKITGLDLTGNDSAGNPTKWLGSTGKAPTSGDVDIALSSTEISKNDLVNKLTQYISSQGLDPKDYIKVAAEIHFKTPIKGNPKNGFAQTDFNIYEPNLYDWSLFYNTWDKNSKFKNRYRAVLMSSISKALGMKLGPKGVYSRVDDKFITMDPDRAAELILGKGFNRNDLSSVETIYKNLANNPKKDILVKDFEDFLAKEGLKKPEITEDSGESNLNKAELHKTLKQAGYENLKDKGNTTVVLVQIPAGRKAAEFRTEMLNEILNILQKTYPQNNPQYVQDPSLSSLGGIVFANNPLKIVVKDSGKQGEKSAGVANELEIASLIQSVIQKYGTADITFVDKDGHKLNIENATEVVTAGRDTGGRKKADVLIKSETSRLPVSIKKLNADMWESADSMIGQRAREVIDKLVSEGYVELKQIGKRSNGAPVYALSKEIVMEPTEQEALAAIFGSDINPEGGVVIQTFKPEHFKQEGNKVTIEAHAVITNKDEIPESHVLLWILRNDSTRNSKAIGYAGIRPLGVTLQRGLGKKGTRKNIIFVDVDGNIIQGDKDEKSKDKPDAGAPVSMQPKARTGVGREKR